MLLLLWPADYIIEFMTVLILLKIAISGWAFTYYLVEHFELTRACEDDSMSETSGIYAFAAAIFGCAYALSAYMAAYAWNIMWLDCMMLVPLIVLGLERMIKTGKPTLYYVSLAACIWSNYYIAIMVCLFLVVWFLISWIEERKMGIAAWARFAWYSLLAGGTGAVLIIPTAVVLGNSGNQGISFPDTVEWYFDITEELARQLMLVDVYTGAEHWPNLYCGVFVLLFFVLYLLNRAIPWKRKVPRILLLALFVASFANNILDFIWHGLHFPTSLPGRQSFLYIFLLLTIVFEALLHLRESRLWHVFVSAVAGGVFITASYRVSDPELIERTAFIVSAVFVGCYLVLVAGYLLGNAMVQRLMLCIGCFAMIAELALNYDVTGFDTVSRTAYTEYMESYKQLLAEAEQRQNDNALENEEVVDFYRIEELERKTKNDAGLYGYRSATQFSSLMNLNVSHFYQDVGMEGGKNFYCASGATPLLSAMLSIRYVLADNDMEAGPLRQMVGAAENAWLYENTYVLPMGFIMSEDVIAAWNYENAGDIGAQNELARLLGAQSDMLVPVPSVSTVGETTIEIDEDGYYYATYEKTSVDQLKAEADDGKSRSYTKVSHGYTLELGYYTAGTTVRVTNDENETVVMMVYRLDENAVGTAVETLQAQTMRMTSFTENQICGTIDVTEPGRLIFSIAKEEGWTLLIDGVKTEQEMFAGAFISAHIEPGVHEIELKYESPGIHLGAGITAGCMLLAVFSMIIQKKKSHKIL